MTRAPRGLSVGPKKMEWVAVVDNAEATLSKMVGRWSDGITPALRAELIRLREPLLSLLIRARLRK